MHILGLTIIIFTAIMAVVANFLFIAYCIEDYEDFGIPKILNEISWYEDGPDEEKIKELNEELAEAKKIRLKYRAKLVGIWVACALLTATLITGGCHCCRVYKRDSFRNYITEIISLERDSEVSGSFFLGSGTVKEEQYYYFYVPTNRGYKLDSKRCKETYIVEDDTITPCLYSCKEAGSYSEYYQLYVPTNTVVKEYHA